MATSKSILPEGSLVVVTGVNGYLASHVVDQLLEQGYAVRGTVRDTKKAAWVPDLFRKRHPKGKFELKSVPDYLKPGVFDSLLEGVSGVIHTVGVVSLGSDPNEIITPTIAILTSLLKSAVAHPSVKSFVLTSSSVAVALPNPGVTFPFNATIWNDGAVAAAWAAPPYTPERSFPVYAASKVESEKAMRKFVEDEKPHFRTNAVLPSTILGEVFSPEHQKGNTADIVTSLITGEETTWDMVPPMPFVNAKDVALLHVAGLTLPGVENERLIGIGGTWSRNDILSILRKQEPGKQLRADFDGEPKDISEIEKKRTDEILKEVKNGQGWTGLEETVGQNTKHLKN